MRSLRQRKDAMDQLFLLLSDIHNYVDVVIVEGLRDFSSLKEIGCQALIEVLGHNGIGDYDLVERISSKYNNVLILTDFDEEGLSLNLRLQSLFERKIAKVETGLRKRIGRLMARIGVYTIESLDNIMNDLGQLTF